jgi:hypothetical protein
LTAERKKTKRDGSIAVATVVAVLGDEEVGGGVTFNNSKEVQSSFLIMKQGLRIFLVNRRGRAPLFRIARFGTVFIIKVGTMALLNITFKGPTGQIRSAQDW